MNAATVERNGTDRSEEIDRLRIKWDRLREERQAKDSEIRELEREAKVEGIDLRPPGDAEIAVDPSTGRGFIDLPEGLTVICESVSDIDGNHFFDFRRDGETLFKGGAIIADIIGRAKLLSAATKELGSDAEDHIRYALNRFACCNKVRKQQSEDPAVKLDRLLADAGVKPAKTIRELLDSEIKHEFIIDNIFAAGMTATIAGASKGMKTSIAVDMALSLILAERFLGRFRIAKQQRVLMFSVESGEASIKETAERVIKSRRLSESLLDDQLRIHGEWIPRSGSDTDAAILQEMIRTWGITVVILDPTYFMIDGDNQANIQKQGQELRAIAQTVLDAGATPVFVDHIKLSSNNAREHQPLELADLSGAGKSAFFRQWLLLSRREKFDPNVPIHRLWMSFGGNHGRHGTWGVDIDESRDEADQRIWDVELKDHTEIKADAERRKEEREAELVAEKEAKQERRLMEYVKRLRIEFKAAGEKGLTKKHAREAAKLNPENCNQAIERMVELNELEPCDVVYPNGRKFGGFRVKQHGIGPSGPSGPIN